MPLTMQGSLICHTLPVMKVQLVSGADMCSNFESGILLAPQARATVNSPPRSSWALLFSLYNHAPVRGAKCFHCTSHCTGWTVFRQKPSAPKPLASEIKDDMHWTQVRTQNKNWVPQNLCIQPLSGFVVYPEAQSAELHKGPLWDAVVDIPMHPPSYGSENPLYGRLYGAKRGMWDSRTGAWLSSWFCCVAFLLRLRPALHPAL